MEIDRITEYTCIDSELVGGPLVELEDKAIKDKAESPRVEKGKVDKMRDASDRVDPIETARVVGRNQHESTNSIDPKQGRMS